MLHTELQVAVDLIQTGRKYLPVVMREADRSEERIETKASRRGLSEIHSSESDLGLDGSAVQCIFSGDEPDTSTPVCPMAATCSGTRNCSLIIMLEES